MAKAIQLPSGSWRVRVYDNELKKQVSFTSTLEGKAGKAEAELMAREYALGRKQKKKAGKTIGESIDEYIAMKENILSPRTISEYRKSKKNDLLSVSDIPLSDITAEDIQKLVNRLALTKSAKTVRNAHGLLASVIHTFRPELYINTTLPKVQKNIKHLPEVEAVMQAVIGSDVELPCLMAIWLGMRLSEIRGAKKSDIHGDILTVNEVIVMVDKVDVVKKQTKTVESCRRLKLPPFIMALIQQLPEEQEHLTELSGTVIYKHFTKLLKAHGIEHMSFHDLRHLNASVMLALGVPDKYAMERGGWSTNNIMKSVYQHTFSAERTAIDNKIDSYFNSILDTIIDTNGE